MSDLQILIDMGFPRMKAEQALAETGNRGVEPAMDWLLTQDVRVEEDDDDLYEDIAFGYAGIHADPVERDASVGAGDVGSANAAAEAARPIIERPRAVMKGAGEECSACSGASDDAYQDAAGTSGGIQAAAAPSGRFQGTAGPSGGIQDIAGPSGGIQDTAGPSGRIQDTAGPSGGIQDIVGPSGESLTAGTSSSGIEMAGFFAGQSEESSEIEAKSLTCDDCGRKFRSDAEIEYHAIKSGHSNFSQSSDEMKQLTEEEKKLQMKKVENLIKQRRVQKEKMEEQEELEKEKARRKTGQELINAKQRLEDEDMKRLADQKRREKIEAKLARQQVLADIERDKAARREKYSSKEKGSPSTSSSSSALVTEKKDFKKYKNTRIQIRLTNGETLLQTFQVNEELAAVRLYIDMNRSDGAEPFTLMTNFPKKEFSQEDMSRTLSSLGLVPSAVLFLVKK